jgi:hypothetical protein
MDLLILEVEVMMLSKMSVTKQVMWLYIPEEWKLNCTDVKA